MFHLNIIPDSSAYIARIQCHAEQRELLVNFILMSSVRMFHNPFLSPLTMRKHDLNFIPFLCKLLCFNLRI